ncbi:MAG TPA: AMP-binding protein, partial [Blastocatellia bacterium]|nr:AMP-binding protein [Blastocatellia bacterium]
MSRTSDSHSFYDLKADSARQYWQRVLSIDHGDAIIRADHSAKASGSIERSLTMKISGATIERLTKLTGGSPFLSYVTLLTALKTCLYRFSRSEVTVVGAPLRAKAGIPGGFSQPLVIVDEIDSGMSFRTLLSNVKETVAEAYQYQDYPPGDLINESAGGENRRAQPQVLLAVKEFHGDRSSPEGNIVFRFEKREAEMPGTVDFDPRQFGADLIQRLIDDFLDILSRALEDPAVSIGELSSLRPNERRQIVQEWNCTSRPFPESCGIHELFIRQVKAAPEAVAIVGDGHHLTYGELNRSANQLAHHLMVKGLEPEGRVALCFERNPWMVIGALGVLKAGGVYLPLDVSYPQDRLAYMLNDAQAEILITQQPLLEHLPLTA